MAASLARRLTVSMTGVFLYWLVAAALVVVVDRLAGHGSTTLVILLKTGVVVLAAFAYMRFGTRDSSLDHALFAGVAWLTLSVITELLTSTHLNHFWFDLLGSPDSSLRNLLMIAWVGSPALFARSE